MTFNHRITLACRLHSSNLHEDACHINQIVTGKVHHVVQFSKINLCVSIYLHLTHKSEKQKGFLSYNLAEDLHWSAGTFYFKHSGHSVFVTLNFVF